MNHIKHQITFPIFIVFAGQEVAGKVTLKHIYEIAKIKCQDECWECEPLEDVCKSLIKSAHTCGIEVVQDLDVEEYRQFLDDRKFIVKGQEQELEDARQAKLMRVS